MVKKSLIVATCSGTILEWYDFSIYAYLAAILADVFFNAETNLALILSYSIFAIGYLARPLGAFVFGHLGDTQGRKKALSLSILSMTIATCGIGLLPSYQTIGIVAPILLLIFRLLQGIAVGGESFGAACFIIESIPSDKKIGFFSSLIWASSVIGLLLGSLIIFLVFLCFQGKLLYSLAWRLPFLLAAISGLLAYYIRARTDETKAFQCLERESSILKFPLKTIFQYHKCLISQLMGLYFLSALITYLVFIFMPVYFADVLGHSRIYANAINTCMLLLLVICDIFFGWLADRTGCKPLMLISAIGFLIISYPLYWIIVHGNLIAVVLAQIIFTLLAASFQGPLTALTLMRIPVAIRYTVGSLGYNIAYSIFGGTAPLIVIYWINKTNNVLMPAYYLMLSAFIAVLMLRSI